LQAKLIVSWIKNWKNKKKLDRNFKAQISWSCSWLVGSAGEFPEVKMMRAGWSSENNQLGIGEALSPAERRRYPIVLVSCEP